MRTGLIAIFLLLGFGLTSCTREDRSHRDEPAARQAGREAYKASQEAKRGAREAAHDLRNASKEFREGWTEAKHADPTRREK